MEALRTVLENPAGLAIICITTASTFFLFPPSSKEEKEDPKENPNAYLTYTTYNPKATWSSDFQVLKAMWFAKITGSDLQERLNCFYEKQADLYDSYRIRMLHGRPLMLQSIARNIQPPPASEQGLVWVDLACGTGYNVENFLLSLDKFSKIYLLDLCIPLCQVAQRDRADKYNSNTSSSSSQPKKIGVIHGDATDFDCEGLPLAGTVDLVTISYSLVMIPDWRKAIANAKRLLKPGGMIGVCDFTLAPDQFGIMKKFWTNTFASDHVFLDEEHLKTLYREFEVVEAVRAYGPLPYTPIVLQPAYYHFCGTKKGE